MSLPNELYDILEQRLGVTIRHAVAVGGGMVAHAARVVTEDGTFFVKWKPGAAPGMFESEADGLARLRAAGTLPVPEVLAVGDAALGHDVEIPFLALEWLEASERSGAALFTENFAVGLARLHRENLSPDGRFGLDRDNFLGRRPQANRWTEEWPAFYRDSRVIPMIETARQAGRLHPQRERRLFELAERIPDLLPACDGASLVHGDLWSGNFLVLGETAALIDPAVYYADREVEIAYIQLFGGFPRGFVDAYHHHFPLDASYAERRLLLQLYPLLVHLATFGEDYGPAVDDACAYYLGQRGHTSGKGTSE